jgi:ABC-type transport system substrate-binding protein
MNIPTMPARRAAMRAVALLVLAAAALLASAVAHAQNPDNGKKVLRLAFARSETGFDPVKLTDLYSRNVTPHIFEGLFTWDHLARPAKIKPLTADGMPQVSSDFKVWTVKIKPGIYFAADPAFKGKKRELIAADYVYSMKRFVDPANKSPIAGSVLEQKLVGLRGLHDDAVKNRKPFDYDAPIEGLQAVDRYTVRYTMEAPSPRYIETLAGGDLFGAVAREVVEHYGDDISAHPVGTGPFRLKSWRRSSRIVLERSPDFREVFYDAEPAPNDAEAQAVFAQMKGKRLPIVDEVEVSIIEESQPMWLAFLNGQVDALVTNAGRVPPDFLNLAMPGGRLAPFLAKQNIVGVRNINADSGLFYFNMEDPTVGGYTADKVALRRAISLAWDVDAEITQIRRGGLRAQSPSVPHTTGFDPQYKSEMGDYDPTRAKALLDTYGYVDRDGDGWRDMPDGKPLLLEIATEPDQLKRKYDELWKKCLTPLGIRIEFKPAQWPENLKSAYAGKLMIWQLASSAAGKDGQSALRRLYSKGGSQNLARFNLEAFDKVYERMEVIEDGPERDKLFLEAKRIAAAYMPYRYTAHRAEADMLHPWVVGFYRRPTFWQEWWHLVDIDLSKKPAH